MRLEAFVRAFLIRSHQARIAHHIRGEDRGETAGGGRGGHCSGGANSRAQFNLLRAGKRQLHAAPWSLRPASAVIPPAFPPCANRRKKWLRTTRGSSAYPTMRPERPSDGRCSKNDRRLSACG